MSVSAEQELDKQTGIFKNLKGKSRLWSSLFSTDVFTPSSSTENIDFEKCVTEIRHTSNIDVYDVIFTVRMPTSVPKGAVWTEHTDKEQYLNFYCNNKLSVKIFFKDPMIFSNTELMEGTTTSCLLSPPVNIDKTTTTYVADDDQGEQTKASGIYFAKYNELNKKINDVLKETISPGTTPSAAQELAFTEKLAKEKKERIAFSDKLYVNLAPSSPGSPFKSYAHHYTHADAENFIMSDNESKEKVKKINKIFGKNEFENFMQFDFNLNNYTINSAGNGVEQRSDKIDEDSEHLKTGDASRKPGDSVLLLLKKDEWFSIILRNITIPLDLQVIPKDMVTIKLEIENSNPIGKIGPNNVFYRNFFCEYLSIHIKRYITKPLKVREFMFGYEDMVVALQSDSKKYDDKLNSMNKLARMVLEYYIKNLNSISSPRGGFDSQYIEMHKDISTSESETTKMFSMTVATPDMKSNLKTNVAKSKKDIVSFSSFFSRDSIISFRNKFIQAIYRELRENGISKINVSKIDKILIQMSQSTDRFGASSTVSTLVPTSLDKKGNVTAVANVTEGSEKLNTSDSEGGAGADGGTTPYIQNIQTGGAPLSDIFGTENYNLMAPMCMVNEGTGLNNMVVRISKKVVQHIDTTMVDDDTPASDELSQVPAYVDIQIGDAIRFVYNGRIVYAIVCGFKPGKKTNEKGNDEEMNMTDFRKTNMKIIASSESQTLKMTPEQYLNVITLRGIKYLTFEYDNDLYSFADCNSREEALSSRNDELKAGLSAKFTFRCDEEKIPFLPNGYRFPTSRKIKEAVTKVKNALTFGSTEADIGMDFNLPSYSLPSYMTLDKVMVPLNFDPIVQLLKSKNDDDLNNPDRIFKSLIKEMELYGLNTSAGCKDNTSKIKMASFQQRKTNFIKMCNNLRAEFNNACMINGVINRKKALIFFKNLYKRTAPPTIFVNEKGIPLKTVPQTVCAFNLLPNDPKEIYNLLITALSSPDIQDINARRQSIGESVKERNAGDDDSAGLLEGGAIPSFQDIQKAENIIKYSIDMIGKQGFIPPNIVNQYSEDLNTVATSYDAKEEEKKLALSSKMVTTMGSSGMSSSGMGSSGMGSNMRGMVGGPSSSSNFLGNFFSNLGKQGSSSASRTGSGIGNDSCGNNTSIVCNGDDLVVTVTLKLNELISSCMNPEMIQHLGNHPGSHPGNHQGNLITNGEGVDEDDAEEIDSSAAAAAAPAPKTPSTFSNAAPSAAATSGAAAAATPSAAATSGAAASTSGAAASTSGAAASTSGAAAATSGAAASTSGAAASTSGAAASTSGAAASTSGASTSDAAVKEVKVNDGPESVISEASVSPSPPPSKDVSSSGETIIPSSEVDSLIAGVNDVLKEVDQLGKIHTVHERGMIDTVKSITKGNIYESNLYDTVIRSLKTINAKKIEDNQKSNEFFESIKSIYKVNIDKYMKTLLAEIKKFNDLYLKHAPPNFQVRVETFKTNITKLDELSTSDKLSPTDKEKVQKILDDFTSTSTKEKEESMVIISKFLKHEISDDKIIDSLYTFVIIEIINNIKDALVAENGKKTIPDFTKLIAIIEGTPSSSIITHGGKNKNNSKKNKQSNKNKTRRRRNSSNKKIKFTKVKKL